MGSGGDLLETWDGPKIVLTYGNNAARIPKGKKALFMDRLNAGQNGRKGAGRGYAARRGKR